MANDFKSSLAGKTSNQKNKRFYNFGLPAVATCINAPGACKDLVQTTQNGRKAPVCFAIRPVTNWPFTKKVASMKGTNCIFKQYANLFLTFDKNKGDFMDYLENVLCPEMKRTFIEYYNNGILAFSPDRDLFKSYEPDNIWNMLYLHYQNSSQDDFLLNVNPKPINGNSIFVNFMINEISKITNKRPRKNSSSDIYIRLHYTGDFYSEEYFKKWISITDYFEQNKRIHFMAYTKEIENIEIWLKNMGRCLHGSKSGINIKLIFSEMKGFGTYNDTSSDAIEAYDRLNESQKCMKYIAVPSIPIGYNGEECKLICGNGCMKCYENTPTNSILVKTF